jgi:hypothetical protein
MWLNSAHFSSQGYHSGHNTADVTYVCKAEIVFITISKNARVERINEGEMPLWITLHNACQLIKSKETAKGKNNGIVRILNKLIELA